MVAIKGDESLYLLILKAPASERSSRVGTHTHTRTRHYNSLSIEFQISYNCFNSRRDSTLAGAPRTPRAAPEAFLLDL